MTLSIVFMGTPDFSVPPLLALHNRGYHIPLVITQPDRPKGRGQKLIQTPVKKTALELGLTVMQPPRINSDDMVAMIEAVKPDFFVVVAFGQLIGERLLSVPRFVAINIHGSLLPAYRGAAPIQRAIINGESRTGITTMLMDKGMDTGDMLLKESMDILDDDTSETLYNRLSLLGAELIVKTLDRYAAQSLTPEVQNPSFATHAPMLTKQEGLIDWTRSAKQLDCTIRGMNPWPGAFTFFSQKRLKIFKALPLDITSQECPGTVLESRVDTLVSRQDKAPCPYVKFREIRGNASLSRIF